jgi:hypothetical protein
MLEIWKYSGLELYEKYYAGTWMSRWVEDG